MKIRIQNLETLKEIELETFERNVRKAVTAFKQDRKRTKDTKRVPNPFKAAF